MTFYLYKSPSECMLDLDSVEVLILERFQQYSEPAVLQYDTEEFNYHDRISHLLMSIIAVSSPYFKESFVKGEIKLFREKLQVIKGSDIKKQLCEASDYLESLLQSEEYAILKSKFSKQFQLMQSIIKTLHSKSSHSFRKSHLKTCRKYKLILPFTSLLKLVSKREVEVKSGKVSLSCGLWNEILEVVFEFLLRIELTLIENCAQLRREIFKSEDDRLRQIVRRFANFLNGNLEEKEIVIRADEIDEMSRFFPPCMANLHQILRSTHRLSYDSRRFMANRNKMFCLQSWYQYTLFLRDIGVSLEDSIFFWESEYRKPHENSTCTHTWTENEKRYKYQIEHLYGLIGSHERKTSHSCQKFVGELQTKMDGGCPFQHMNPEQLKNALPKSVAELPDVEDIFLYKSNSLPQKACSVYLSCLLKVLTKKRMNIFYDTVNANRLFHVVSPLQFFNIAKNF